MSLELWRWCLLELESWRHTQALNRPSLCGSRYGFPLQGWCTTWEMTRTIVGTLTRGIKIYHCRFLSRNYAAFAWCLDELVKILECKKERSQFCQSSIIWIPWMQWRKRWVFGEAFAQLIEQIFEDADTVEKVVIWRPSLFEAANIFFFPSKHTSLEWI